MTLGIAAHSLSTTCCSYFPVSLGSAAEEQDTWEGTGKKSQHIQAWCLQLWDLVHTNYRKLHAAASSCGVIEFLLVFNYSRSGLVLFMWFFHWAAAAAMDGMEWSWDNLRTSLLMLLLSPSLRTFFSLLSFFKCIFASKMLWFEGQGWWAGYHMPCWGGCWGWKQELSASSLHSPSCPWEIPHSPVPVPHHMLTQQ